MYETLVARPAHGSGHKECKDACDCNGVPCGEYLYDHRNASLRAWLVDEHVMGTARGMGNVNVSPRLAYNHAPRSVSFESCMEGSAHADGLSNAILLWQVSGFYFDDYWLNSGYCYATVM